MFTPNDRHETLITLGERLPRADDAAKPAPAGLKAINKAEGVYQNSEGKFVTLRPVVGPRHAPPPIEQVVAEKRKQMAAAGPFGGLAMLQRAQQKAEKDAFMQALDATPPFNARAEWDRTTDPARADIGVPGTAAEFDRAAAGVQLQVGDTGKTVVFRRYRPAAPSPVYRAQDVEDAIVSLLCSIGFPMISPIRARSAARTLMGGQSENMPIDIFHRTVEHAMGRLPVRSELDQFDARLHQFHAANGRGCCSDPLNQRSQIGTEWGTEVGHDHATDAMRYALDAAVPLRYYPSSKILITKNMTSQELGAITAQHPECSVMFAPGFSIVDGTANREPEKQIPPSGRNWWEAGL